MCHVRISDKQTSETSFTMTKADGQEREITIKSAGVLSFSEDGSDDDDSQKSHMTHLTILQADAKTATEKDVVAFDSDLHDHADFSSGDTAALRITDEGMIIADCIENYTKQNETMPRQALQEQHVMANLFVHKVDHCTLELQMEPEEMHDRFGSVMSQLPRTDFFSPGFDAITQVCRARFLTDVGGFSLSVSLLFFHTTTDWTVFTEYGRAGGRLKKKTKHVIQWNRTTAHQSSREEIGYEFQEFQEFQDCIFMQATQENDEIFGGGMNKDRDVNFYMTVHVRTISGKTTSIKCDKRQIIAGIMDEVERKTMIPKDFHHFANQWKALSDKKTMEESNIEAETTIEMSMRLQGGKESRMSSVVTR